MSVRQLLPLKTAETFLKKTVNPCTSAATASDLQVVNVDSHDQEQNHFAINLLEPKEEVVVEDGRVGTGVLLKVRDQSELEHQRRVGEAVHSS